MMGGQISAKNGAVRNTAYRENQPGRTARRRSVRFYQLGTAKIPLEASGQSAVTVRRAADGSPRVSAMTRRVCAAPCYAAWMPRSWELCRQLVSRKGKYTGAGVRCSVSGVEWRRGELWAGAHRCWITPCNECGDHTPRSVSSVFRARAGVISDQWSAISCQLSAVSRQPLVH